MKIKKKFLKALKTYTISTMNCLKKSGLLPKKILAVLEIIFLVMMLTEKNFSLLRSTARVLSE